MHETGKFGVRSRALAAGWAALLALRIAFAANEPIEFNIEAQGLGQALNEFALQSGREILFSEADTHQRKSIRLAGRYTAEEALRLLLQESGLRYTVTELNTVLIGSLASTRQTNSAGPAPSPATSPPQTEGAPASPETTAGETPPERAPERSAWDLAEVTVFGTRSARETSLNQQRLADNSSFVLSADALGNFTGTTISEALRRVPGVAFQRDSLTGDGTNVILRGLEPRMNMVTLNGLSLPVGNGTDRAASLNNLLADSVDTITVHHALLPSMNSAGSGGLVEIETKSPLQRPQRFASFGVETGRTIAGNFLDDFVGTGTVSGIFGTQGNLGLSASVQYRKRDIRSVQYDVTVEPGLFLPLERDGSLNILSGSDVDPFVSFPFETGADQFYVQGLNANSRRGETAALVATVSGEWRPTARFGLRLDVQRADSKSTGFTRDSSANQGTLRMPTPIAALGGEERQMLFWDGQLTLSNSSGVDDARDITDTVSLRGDWSPGRWQHRFTAGLAEGSNEFDRFSVDTGDPFFGTFAIDPAWVRPEAQDPAQGQVISLFGERSGRGMQLPLLNEAGWEFLNDPANQFFKFGSRGVGRGSNDRYSGEWSTRYSFHRPHVKYLEAGANFESSQFANRNRIFILNPTAFPVSAADLGLTFGDPGFAAVGLGEPGFSVVSRDALEAFRDRVAAAQSGGDVGIVESEYQQDPRLFRSSTKEKDLSLYLQAQVDFGRLEIVGGARLNRVDVEAFNLRSHHVIRQDGSRDEEFRERFTQLVDESGVTTDILPRIGFNFRHSENLIFRGSYNFAVARPDVAQLSSVAQFTLDLSGLNELPFGAERLAVSLGNPLLEPALTHSFDFSIEHYSSSIGLLRIGAFYKRIENLLQQNFQADGAQDPRDLDLPDDPYYDELLADPDRLAALIVRVSRPENNPHAARIWGMDLHLERQFTFLPGIWSGFGIFGNLTFTESSKRHRYAWFQSPVFDGDGNFIGRELQQLVIPSISFEQQPKFSGTFALTYNQYDIDATLAWSGQSRRKNSFQANGLGYFEEQDSSLDFRIERRMKLGSNAWNVYLEGADLLRGAHDPDMLTAMGDSGQAARMYRTGSYFGGRQFRLGVKASF